MEADLTAPSQKHLDRAREIVAEHLHYAFGATHFAPADERLTERLAAEFASIATEARRRAIEDVVRICDGERLPADEVNDEADRAYNGAIVDCICAIRPLSEIPARSEVETPPDVLVALNEAIEIIIWMSGSSDFAPEGQA